MLTQLLTALTVILKPFNMCLAKKREYKHVLFPHALTGCDTTSSLFSKSKLETYRHFGKCEERNLAFSIFGSENANRKELTDISTKALASLFDGQIQRYRL